jgi:SAM-dependent methyltransferase
VIAVDESGDLLARLRAKARDLGLEDRVQTVEADLDQAWPALGPVDVTWTSMALHHLADPDRALREIFAATRPGGLVAVAESTAPMRFLPDDIGLGRPGLEARAQSAGRYAQAYLRRVRGHLDGALAADDLATLDVLIGDDGPGSVLRRRDLAIRNTRTIWTATRA